MTVYEIVRGLKATGATQQLAHFNAVVDSNDVIPIDTAILMRAGGKQSAAPGTSTNVNQP